MNIVCPDCGRTFYASMKTLAMLADSFKINPNLKFICGRCGDAIMRRYYPPR